MARNLGELCAFFNQTVLPFHCLQDVSEKRIPIMLCANKVDLRLEACAAGRKCVSTEEGERTAREHSAVFIETSAKDGNNVFDALVHLARSVTDATLLSFVCLQQRCKLIRVSTAAFLRFVTACTVQAVSAESSKSAFVKRQNVQIKCSSTMNRDMCSSEDVEVQTSALKIREEGNKKKCC